MMEESDWMDCESSSESSSSHSDDEERQRAILKVVDNINVGEKYKFFGSLGRGTYGDVLQILDLNQNVYKAAKIIVPRNTVDLEKTIWPELNHPNILAVEELIVMPDKTLMFVTPLMYKAMHDIVLNYKFKFFYEFNHNAVKKWLKEILLGLEYMHNNLYCHLDIKLDNILIGYNGEACVCDFSFVNYRLEPLHIDDVGLPQAYRPPEAFKKESRKAMNGMAIDMWAYGILVVEAYSNQHLLDNIDDCKSFVKDITPVLEAILEEETFYGLVRHTYPDYMFTDNELWNALDFIDQFLRIHPSQRKSASYCLNHNFLESAENFYVYMVEIFSEIEQYSEKDLITEEYKEQILDEDENDPTPFHSPYSLNNSIPHALQKIEKRVKSKCKMLKPMKFKRNIKKSKVFTKREFRKKLNKKIVKNAILTELESAKHHMAEKNSILTVISNVYSSPCSTEYFSSKDDDAISNVRDLEGSIENGRGNGEIFNKKDKSRHFNQENEDCWYEQNEGCLYEQNEDYLFEQDEDFLHEINEENLGIIKKYSNEVNEERKLILECGSEKNDTNLNIEILSDEINDCKPTIDSENMISFSILGYKNDYKDNYSSEYTNDQGDYVEININNNEKNREINKSENKTLKTNEIEENDDETKSSLSFKYESKWCRLRSWIKEKYNQFFKIFCWCFASDKDYEEILINDNFEQYYDCQ